MPVAVVDCLEPVEVLEQQRGRGAPSVGEAQCFVQSVSTLSPIRQGSEIVVQGQVAVVKRAGLAVLELHLGALQSGKRLRVFLFELAASVALLMQLKV